jgi:glycosyl transferase family 1
MPAAPALPAPPSAPRPLAAAPAPEARPALRVASFATQGTGSGDEARIRALLAPLDAEPLPFDRARKLRSGVALLRRLRRERPDVVVMEGTGIAGGLAVLGAGVPFIVSSGDAVGPFVGIEHPALGLAARAYERLLCSRSAGFIGWSPYLVGRAIGLGARRAMTAAHWAPAAPDPAERARLRAATRRELGIPADAIVVGLAGSLGWSRRRSYCYGLELVRALRATTRQDLRILVVGDGDGRAELERAAGDELGGRVLLPGAVARERVLPMLCAMDAASLPQSLDEVGALRYTTKLSEYLAAGLPVLTGRLPLAYDLDDGWLWRLEGSAPWDPRYVAALAERLRTLDRPALAVAADRVPTRLALFDFDRQQRSVHHFVTETARDHHARRSQGGPDAAR